MKIFISKSGGLGNTISSELKALIQNKVKGTEVFDSELDLRIGSDWLKIIKESINECDILISLIDINFLKSQYCHMETGLYLNTNSPNYFPVIIDEVDINNIPTVFERKHLLYYYLKNNQSKKNIAFEKLLESIHKIKYPNGQKIFLVPRLEIKESIIRIEAAFDVLQNEIRNNSDKIDYFFERVSESIENNARTLQFEERKIKFYKEYWLTSRNEFIATKIHSISKTIDHSKSEMYDDSNNWKSIWSEMAENQLKMFTQTLSFLRSRKIKLVDTFHIKDFWMRQIMKRVTNQIWTTNLPGTNGRKINNAFITVQKKAISDNDVNITRVFIYEPEDHEDQQNLIDVIKAQLEIGVDIFLLTQYDFDESRANSAFDAKVLDFMVIDEKYIYTTEIDSSGNVKALEFTDDTTMLEELSDLREQVEERWEPVTDIERLKELLGLEIITNDK